MKQIFKCLLVFVAIMMASTNVWASEINIIRQWNGTVNDAAGEVVASGPVDGVVTLTVTPAEGNYIKAENITVERTVLGGSAHTRLKVPGMDGNDIELTPIDVTDPSGTTTYSFVMPDDENYDVEVVADFQSRIPIDDATVTLAETMLTYDGDEKEPEVSSVVVGDYTFEASDYTVTYENNINAGTATVKITGQGICIGEASTTFTIEKAPINDDLMMVRIEDWTYGESPSAPYVEGAPNGVEVQYAYFVMDEEYGEFVELDDVPTNAGGYVISAIIAETDNYLEGTLFNEFTIMQADFSEVVIADIADQTFTSESIEPAITVTFKGNPVDASEYSIVYSDNQAVGTATVTLTTNNINFAEGEVNPSKTFQIVSAQANIFAEDQTVTYNGDAQEFSSYEADCGEVTVLYYASEENRQAGEEALEQVIDAGVYYVALVPADASYQCEDTYATFTILPKELTDDMLSIVNQSDFYILNNSPLTPSVAVNDDDNLLTENEDYTVSYSDNDKVGVATVTVEGTNNYQGTVSKTFDIVRQLDVSFGESNSWATYFAAEDLSTPEGLLAYIVTGVNNRSVTVVNVDYIPQGVAVLLEKKADAYNDIAFAYDGQPGTFEGNMLVGCATATDVAALTGEDNIYVLYNNEFVRSTKGTIPANRCYLPVAKSAAAPARLTISMENEETGIAEMMNSINVENEKVYNLNGMRVTNPAKGLYIMNGKKIVVK